MKVRGSQLLSCSRHPSLGCQVNTSLYFMLHIVSGRVKLTKGTEICLWPVPLTLRCTPNSPKEGLKMGSPGPVSNNSFSKQGRTICILTNAPGNVEAMGLDHPSETLPWEILPSPGHFTAVPCKGEALVPGAGRKRNFYLHLVFNSLEISVRFCMCISFYTAHWYNGTYKLVYKKSMGKQAQTVFIW